MSDDVSASTIDLDDLSERVHRLAVECEHRARSLFEAAGLVPRDRHFHANAIGQRVSDVSRNLTAVSTALATTSANYAQREAFLSAATHELTSTLFWALGRVVAALAPAAIPAVMGGIIALLAAAAFTGKRPEELIMTIASGAATLGAEEKDETASDALISVISSPQFVEGLKYTVSGIDDFAAGMLGLPLPLIAGLGERGAGLSDPSTMAGAIVLGAGVLGAAVRGAGGDAPTLLAETPVVMSRVSAEVGRAPRGVEELVQRIPRADPEMPQVRIERYQGAAGEHPSFIVYLGGTIDAGLLATDEPWDMTSNLGALAGMDSGSYRAALSAMRAAGIGSDDPVMLVGHSQGGILAARIAQSQQFHVSDVLTVGAPIHQVAIPGDVTVTAIEHTEDLIPTLGGVTLGITAAATLRARLGTKLGSTTTVRRSALGGLIRTDDDPLPGHNLSRYIETGRVIDHSADHRLVALRSRLNVNTRGAAEVTLWRAERVTP